MLEKQILANILKHWSISQEAIATCEQLLDKPVFLITTRQGEKLVLKAAAERSQAQRFEALYPLWRYLRVSGMRVAVPFLSDAGTCAVPYQEELYTLSPYLSGTRGAGGPRSDTYILIGRALGRLHNALAAYPDTLPSWHMDLVSEVFEHDVARILAYSQGAERSRLVAVNAAIELGIRETCTNLPAQYLHGDCGGSNFLIDGDNVAIIDLDHLHWGPRIYDLAYFLTVGPGEMEHRINTYHHRPAEAFPSSP